MLSQAPTRKDELMSKLKKWAISEEAKKKLPGTYRVISFRMVKDVCGNDRECATIEFRHMADPVGTVRHAEFDIHTGEHVGRDAVPINKQVTMENSMNEGYEQRRKESEGNRELLSQAISRLIQKGFRTFMLDFVRNISTGKKILAIKDWRAITGDDLKDSKERVEMLMKILPKEPTAEAAEENVSLRKKVHDLSNQQAFVVNENRVLRDQLGVSQKELEHLLDQRDDLRKEIEDRDEDLADYTILVNKISEELRLVKQKADAFRIVVKDLASS